LNSRRLSARVVPGRAGVRPDAMAHRRDASGGNRRRRLVAGLAFVAAIGLAAGVWVLTTSARFEIDKVESSRYRFTLKADLDDRLRGWLDQRLNIWTFDGDSLSREVESLTWVRRAEIVRKLPSTLQVNLWEWRPLLLLPDDVGGRALVRSGDLLPLPRHLPTPDLPVLVAVDGAAPLDAAEIVRILDLLDAIRETGLETETEVDFIIREQRGLAVLLAGNRRRLVVGREAFATRLLRYLGVADRLPADAEIDLRFARKVYTDEST